jgi:G10 protein
MPKVRRSKKPPPEGWELIEPTLDEIEQKMREGETYFCSTLGILSCNLAVYTRPFRAAR